MTTRARNTANSQDGLRHGGRQSLVPSAPLDLDALERDGEDPGPFIFKLGGREYELVSPEVLDYRELVDAMVAGTKGDVVGALNKLLDEDDHEDFWANRIPAFKLQALVSGFLEHYGLAEKS